MNIKAMETGSNTVILYICKKTAAQPLFFALYNFHKNHTEQSNDTL